MKFLAADTDGRGDTVYANMTSLAPYLYELGHAYYNQRIKKLVEEENRSYTKIKNEIDNAIGTIISEKIKRNDDFLKQKISVYAWIGYKNHKYGEIIAECFLYGYQKKDCAYVVSLIKWRGAIVMMHISQEMKKLGKLWDDAKKQEERDKITKQMQELDKKERKELEIPDDMEF